jgi:molybdopterin-guanine dinucleotide biosynthesis protein A
LSCDNPLIEKRVFEYLIERCQSFDCCIPQWNNGFLEPLFTIYPINKALVTAKKNLKKKTYKLTNLISPNWKTKFVSIEGEIQPLDNNLITFLNINDPTDLEKLKEKKN